EDLTELPGIGDDLAAKIREIVQTGKCAMLEKLRREMPAAVTDLLKVPGLGPKRVGRLWRELKLRAPEQGLRAARPPRPRALSGFGEKTERQIEAALSAQIAKKGRTQLGVAAQQAVPLVKHLEQSRGVHQVVVAGSYRRKRETIGDLDILVTARKASDAIERF